MGASEISLYLTPAEGGENDRRGEFYFIFPGDQLAASDICISIQSRRRGWS